MRRGLNLGCGKDIRKSNEEIKWCNIDNAFLHNEVVFYDLNCIPYPFPQEDNDIILLNDVLEHLEDPIGVIQECYRLLKKGGKLKIRVLYWNHIYNYSDPQHKHVFAPRYFEMFTKASVRDYYFSFAFERMRIRYTFDVKAIKEFGFNKQDLMKKAYFLCNIIDGMRVTLYK